MSETANVTRTVVHLKLQSTPTVEFSGNLVWTLEDDGMLRFYDDDGDSPREYCFNWSDVLYFTQE